MKVKIGNKEIPEEELLERSKKYKEKQPVIVEAVQIISCFKIKYPDSGLTVSGAPGDYLVKNERGELGIIQKEIFERYYDEI